MNIEKIESFQRSFRLLQDLCSKIVAKLVELLQYRYNMGPIGLWTDICFLLRYKTHADGAQTAFGQEAASETLPKSNSTAKRIPFCSLTVGTT